MGFVCLGMRQGATNLKTKIQGPLQRPTRQKGDEAISIRRTDILRTTVKKLGSPGDLAPGICPPVV